ncbi:MAG: hypothetical protein B7X39_11595 [Lysobacterales bacterium 14-68-21]|nr:MAG: hypothetical protein B7X45_11630 [Xanthomonadales bacterium 15-68-25]OZB66133.1 MAG: hypothetical protein B7X39_11595 [Xanthomonadales bacterium 14-68-21]
MTIPLHLQRLDLLNHRTALSLNGDLFGLLTSQFHHHTVVPIHQRLEGLLGGVHGELLLREQLPSLLQLFPLLKRRHPSGIKFL